MLTPDGGGIAGPACAAAQAREARHNQPLWDALTDGTLDMIATGHAPHTPEEKTRESTPVGFENHTSHPSKGDILFHPGGYSETEIILAYGACSFSSRMGQLAGNHFLTIVEGH